MYWINDWNDIIRHVIFSDKTLKDLMKIPDGTSIIDFIDRYFIRAGYTNKLLSNEAVSVVYGTTSSTSDVDGVTSNTMNFDIYVKIENLHDVGTDRLVMRTQLIGQRLLYLLTKARYNGVYRFYDPIECDMGTSAIGYARYRVSVSYTRSY